MQVQSVSFRALRGGEALCSVVARYGLLERLGVTTRRQGVGLLGFGLGARELRVVVSGGRQQVSNVIRGVKVGTIAAARSQGVAVRWSETECGPGREVDRAVVWAHQACRRTANGSPLASPWTSHRDLLGFRSARFYDGAAAREWVDVDRVHVLAGGRAVPTNVRPVKGASGSLVLRVAAAVVGVLPANRRCFRLFTHMADASGWSSLRIAGALALTSRRVRQMAAEREPLLSTGLTALADSRLCIVP